MGWFDDAWDSVSGAAEDAWDSAVDTAETWAEDTWNQAEAWVDQATSDAGSWVEEAWSDVSSEATSFLGDFGGAVGDGIGWFGTAVDDATFGLAGEAMGALDESVFDAVDYITDGVIDINWVEGEGISGSIGLGPIGGLSASLGESGISYGGAIPGASWDMGLGDQGLLLASSGGIDIEGFPYVAGHMEVTPDGNVMMNGEIQGTLPTPVGLLSGEASGGFVRTDQGWGGYVAADGTLTMPSGTIIGGNLAAQYAEMGGQTIGGISVGGSITEPGLGTIGGQAGYQYMQDADGNVIEGAHLEGRASGFGMEASAEADYVGGEVDGQSFGGWTTDTDFQGFDADNIMALGQSILGESGEGGGSMLPDSLDGLVGALGDGQAGQLLGNLIGSEGGSTQLGGFLNNLGGDATSQFLGQLASEGAIGDLLGNVGGGDLQNVLGNLSQSGQLADVLTNLDTNTTADLIGKLIGGGGAATAGVADIATSTLGEVAGQVPGGDNVVDDVLGLDTDMAPGVMTAPAPALQDTSDDIVMGDVAAATPVGLADGVPAGAAEHASDQGLAHMANQTVAPEEFVADADAEMPDVPPAPEAPEAEPEMDDFSQKVEAADAVEDSLDDMFENLE